MHVLVLGARAPACLEWVRAFRAAQWRVSAGDSLRWPVARASRAIDGFVRLPEPRPDPPRWADALAREVEARGIDLVLPTCEEVFYLAHHRERIPARVLAPPFELLHELHHKGRFAARVAGWPVQAPETHMLATAQDAQEFATRQDAGAWVFKPAYSRFASRTLLRPDPARVRALAPTPEQPWVAQRFVEGREHCSFSLLVAGRLTAHACYHPRYRVGRGSGIWFEPTDPAPIRAFVERFGAETGYTGQVAFDFLERSDGSCRVIECNPRATSGVHLFDDQPHALVAALLGADGVCTPSAAPRQVALAMLLFALWRHGLEPRFWHDVRAARDVISRPGDRGPLAAQVPGLIEVTGRAIARRSGLLAAATADTEWNGEPLDRPPCA
jgi:glutathione synthase/RimK-type ligase-like ATP-grasp enzyme